MRGKLEQPDDFGVEHGERGLRDKRLNRRGRDEPGIECDERRWIGGARVL
ncbi:MAG TPA: hypothetical protein VEF89_24365 [Solirubrobacteraceae bacterium]|nr:hypothetical protein [Solirubrobacteraceae bacterium]